MSGEDFIRLRISERINILKNRGEYIGSRDLPTHFAYLFALDRFFVEVYVIKAMNSIQWVEIQQNREILKEYVDSIELRF